MKKHCLQYTPTIPQQSKNKSAKYNNSLNKGTFYMLLQMIFGNSPEKISLVIFIPMLKPNALGLIKHVIVLCIIISDNVECNRPTSY